MSRELWTGVDRYIEERLLGPDAALEGALADSAAAGLPPIQVSPAQGRLLTLLALTRGAKRILEIGTLGGYSAICLARGLGAGGRLISLELVEQHAEVARRNVARAGLAERVEIRVGPALESLAAMEGEGPEPFDLVFIDADKQTIPQYFDWALKSSRMGTLIIVDNVVRDGALIDGNVNDEAIQGVRKFHEQLKGEKRVTATTIQTVGCKGYDGLTFALVV